MADASTARFARSLRTAVLADVDTLEPLIVESVRALHRAHYTPAQIERGLEQVYGVDRRLITDGTYFVVEEFAAVVACGGWSKRAALHGGDRYGVRDDRLLDPASEAAKIRAFYVRPAAARRGLASLLLRACEDAARAAGFTRAELSATKTGAEFYAARGYRRTGTLDVPLTGADPLPVVLMERSLERSR